jgi:hypothetical protein
METIVNKNEYSREDYLNNKKVIENEDKIYEFVNRLKIGEYKSILYNGQTPILEDDTGFLDFILDDLNEDSTVKLINNDVLVIHTDKEIIELKGYKDMSDKEIVARKYLDQCEGTLIIKDHEMQVEFTDKNFINIEKVDYYNN